MKTFKQTLCFVVVACLASLPSSPAQTVLCDGLFDCIDSDSFRLCSSPSNVTYSCEGGTYCSNNSTFPCATSPDCTPGCNDAGFYCLSDSEYKQCVDANPPSGDVIRCPDSLVCSMDCDVECSPTPCNSTSPCSEVGINPDPANPRNFILCSTECTGALQATQYTCPQNYTFDADRACVIMGESPKCGHAHFHCLDSTEFSVCVDGGAPEGQYTCPQGTFCHENNDQPCSASLPTTTTPPPFVCEREGKFPDLNNCSVYNMCFRKDSGGFHQMTLSCPGSSFFNPVTGQCTRNPGVCSLTTTPPTITTASPTTSSPTTPSPFVCTAAGRFPDPTSCDHYYQCTRRWLGGGLSQRRRRCSWRTQFDSVRSRCVMRGTATCAAQEG